MSNRNRAKGAQGFFGDRYFQSAAFNQRTFYNYVNWIVSLALARFKWEGLPDSVNERFLEKTLLTNGQATIAHPAEMPDMWNGLQVASAYELNMYGEPVKWDALGFDGHTRYPVTRGENGVLVWENRAWTSPWEGIQLLARKLTHYDRTEDINLFHQQTPAILTAPREQKRTLENAYKQIAGGEPIILADDNFMDTVQINVLKTDVPFICNDLHLAYMNTWNNVYRFLGIEHLAFEKGERMIEEEANANQIPTSLKLANELDARKDACRELASLGLDVDVHFNDNAVVELMPTMPESEVNGNAVD